eukprot:4769537-Pleurochrysis_carterae.AAC.1
MAGCQSIKSVKIIAVDGAGIQLAGRPAGLCTSPEWDMRRQKSSRTHSVPTTHVRPPTYPPSVSDGSLVVIRGMTACSHRRA